MNIFRYEAHAHSDPDFPIIFHSRIVAENGTIDKNFQVVPHWHGGVEILYCLEGSMEVTCNQNKWLMQQDDMVVVNSNTLHVVGSAGISLYHCLIVDADFLLKNGFPVETMLLEDFFAGKDFFPLFHCIDTEIKEKAQLYKSRVRGYLLELFVRLYREHGTKMQPEQAGKQNSKIQLVKSAIAYIHNHYTEDITIDEISDTLGFSKYYVCHIFKEYTGRTMVDYINLLRCINARSLLSSGKYNISESAASSGFKNLSYFTRTYKKQMGALPSAHQKEDGLNPPDST